MIQGWVDINMVVGGGWPPSEMNSMSLDEYGQWYEKAVEANHQQQQAMKG